VIRTALRHEFRVALDPVRVQITKRREFVLQRMICGQLSHRANRRIKQLIFSFATALKSICDANSISGKAAAAQVRFRHQSVVGQKVWTDQQRGFPQTTTGIDRVNRLRQSDKRGKTCQ